MVLVGVSAVVHVHWLLAVGVALVATAVLRRSVIFPLLLRWTARRIGESDAPLDVRWPYVVVDITLFVAIVIGIANAFHGARGVLWVALALSLVMTVVSWARDKRQKATEPSADPSEPAEDRPA
jgi:hypothetical protein